MAALLLTGSPGPSAMLAGVAVAVSFAVLRLVRQSRKRPPVAPPAGRRPPRPPQPQVLASLVLEGNVLRVQLAGRADETCSLDHVRVLSVVVGRAGEEVRRTVNLRGMGRCNLNFAPLSAGVEVLLARLDSLPGFTRDAWTRALAETAPGRYPFWKRVLTVESSIAPQPALKAALAEFARGLVLARDTGGRATSLLPWETTFDELAARPEISVAQNEFDWPEARFLVSPQIGGLLLGNAWVYLPHVYRRDVPVAEWTAYVTLSDRWAKGRDAPNFQLLAAYLTSLFGASRPSPGHTANEAIGVWTAEGITLQVVYWFNSASATESGYCWLSVRNGRPYSSYRTDAYVTSVQPRRVRLQVFALADARVERDFRKSRWSRIMPPGLKAAAGSGWLVWVDDAAGRLGFGAGEDAIVAPRAEAVRLELQNLAPARGGGSATLTLVDRDGQVVTVGSSRFKAFDPLLDEIRQLTGLAIEIKREWMDD